MPAYKYKNRAGKTLWGFQFSLPGSSRKDRKRVFGRGFATKGAATDAEAARRMEEAKRRELEKAGASPSELPKTLLALIDEFFRRHVDKNLAPKTVERYREQVLYLNPDLLAMQITNITHLHLNREWDRLLKCGGHPRQTKAPRPLSTKTVRNIAGVVSSAFASAVKWGLVATNPLPTASRLK